MGARGVDSNIGGGVTGPASRNRGQVAAFTTTHHKAGKGMHANKQPISELTDTDETISRATAPTPPAPRPVTSGELWRRDLPYMLGMIPLIVFLIGALAGWWGR